MRGLLLSDYDILFASDLLLHTGYTSGTSDVDMSTSPEAQQPLQQQASHRRRLQVNPESSRASPSFSDFSPASDSCCC